MTIDAEAFDAELRRVVDRLRYLPAARVPDAIDPSERAGTELLAISARLGDPAPMALPKVRPTALGDQLAVLGADVRRAAAAADDAAALQEATTVLVRLRRSL